PARRRRKGPSPAGTSEGVPGDSVLRRDPKLLVLVQHPDHDPPVLGDEAHELLRDVLDLVVRLQLLDAGAGVSALAFAAGGRQLLRLASNPRGKRRGRKRTGGGVLGRDTRAGGEAKGGTLKGGVRDRWGEVWEEVGWWR